MAGPAPLPTDSPLLRGLFGVFQSGAAVGASTSEVWQDLRTAAGSWQFQAQGIAQPFDPAAVTEAGRQILSAQGINAATVSTFRGVAGSWLSAANSLQRLEQNQQITARDVFTPPWSITAGENTPSRYRVRTQWQIEPAVGDVFTKWKADEVTGPLTTLADVLGQAEPTANTQSGQQILSGLFAPVLLSYEIEQI